MEYLTLENIEKVLTIVGIISTIVAPLATPKILYAKKVLQETANFLEKDEKPNKDIYKKAINQGLFHLADHINQTIEPGRNFDKLG